MRTLLVLLRLRGEMSAGEVAARFSQAWPTATRHLRVLERAGPVRFGRQGRRRVYRVEHGRLGLVAEWLSWFDRPGGGIRDDAACRWTMREEDRWVRAR